MENRENSVSRDNILISDEELNEETAFYNRRFKKKKKKYQYRAFLWLLVPFVFLAIFSFYPPIKAFADSFFDVNVRNESFFVGFGNYIEIFKDEVFWICIKNVLIFTAVGMVCGNFMTIFLAELLFNLKNKKLAAFFRVLFIIPILVPSIVILLIWKYVMFGSTGLMNQLSTALGSGTHLWYWDDNDFIAKFAIIFTNFPWVAGTSFLIYLAGLQNIPKSVMEASQLDNCSTLKRIFKVDMPLIKSQLKYFLVMGCIGGFQNFDLQLVVVGGETDATNVLGLYLYDRAFGLAGDALNRTRFGYASAVGMIILVITLGLSIFNLNLKEDKTPKKKKIKKEVNA